MNIDCSHDFEPNVAKGFVTLMIVFNSTYRQIKRRK